MAKDLNEHFCKKDKQMANRHRKRCSTSLIIREMQIRTIMRYHLTPARMAIIKKKKKKKVGGIGGKGTCLHSWWEYVGTATMENSMEVSKLKTELPYDSAIPLLGLYPENNMNGYMHPSVDCSILYNTQDMKAN